MKSIELFAGAGGMALGFDLAGFENVALNEVDKDACNTLRENRPSWNVLEGDIKDIDWGAYQDKGVDVIAGGFPCQSFSYSGKRLGLEDTRGTLFYEFAKAVSIVKPTLFVAENVKGLLRHDNGRTIRVIQETFESVGYYLFEPLLVNANDFMVAQKRERVFLFGVKKEYRDFFQGINPKKEKRINLEDIFIKDDIYKNPIPVELQYGYEYSKEKRVLFDLIPEGGNWRDLPVDLQKEYMGNMFYSGGGKTGVLKRLSFNEPSVTILTSPSQKQTERCYPNESRPLTVRESARIQSFPDSWIFCGSVSSQYKQVGNAVPVNLAKAIADNIYQQLVSFKKIA